MKSKNVITFVSVCMFLTYIVKDNRGLALGPHTNGGERSRTHYANLPLELGPPEVLSMGSELVYNSDFNEGEYLFSPWAVVGKALKFNVHPNISKNKNYVYAVSNQENNGLVRIKKAGKEYAALRWEAVNGTYNVKQSHSNIDGNKLNRNMSFVKENERWSLHQVSECVEYKLGGTDCYQVTGNVCKDLLKDQVQQASSSIDTNKPELLDACAQNLASQINNTNIREGVSFINASGNTNTPGKVNNFNELIKKRLDRTRELCKKFGALFKTHTPETSDGRPSLPQGPAGSQAL